MNSSGIKRGLAIVATAAVAVGTPAAVFAAGSGDRDVYAISQSADHPSLPQYSFATIDGTASAKGGADLYTDANNNHVSNTGEEKTLSVTLSEVVPAGTSFDSADPDIFTYDEDGPDASGNFNADDVWTASELGVDLTDTSVAAHSGSTYTLKAATTFKTPALADVTPFIQDATGRTTNAFEYAVASNAPGTVTATTGDVQSGGTASTSITVNAVKSGPQNVASISVTPASVNQYESDPAPVYKVTALDANGVAVDGVQIQVAESNNHAITPQTTADGTTFHSYVAGEATTSLAAPGDDGSVLIRVPSSGTSTTSVTDNLVFFVDEPASPTTGPDAADPQKSVTATFTADPSSTTDYELSDATVKAADDTLPADNAAVTETVTVFVPAHDYTTTNKHGAAGIRIAVVADDGGSYSDTQLATTGTDGKATVTFTIPKADTDPANAPVDVDFDAYISGSTTDPTTGAHLGGDTLTIEKRATFVNYNDAFDSAAATAAADNTTSAQAVAGGTVTLPITVTDQFGKPAANQTLAYTITHAGVVNRGNDTATSAVPVTTDANGKATITYTDQAKNGATKADQDTVYVYDPFGGVLATDGSNNPAPTNETGDLKINVQYLASLTADATNSKYGSGATYLGTGVAPSVNADPNTAAVNGVPSWAQVVSVDPTYFSSLTDAPHDTYSVYLASSDNEKLVGQPVTFSAPGGVLLDPTSDPTNPAFGLGTLTVTTDSNGVATVTLTAITAGDVSLTATAGNFSHTFNPVRFDPDKAYNLSLASQPETITPGSSSKFVYNVEDQFGNKIYGTGPDGVNPNFTGAGTTGAAPNVNSTGTMAVFVQGSTGNATDPGTVNNGATGSQVDKNSQAAVVLTTLDSDTGSGTLVVTGTGNVAAAKYAPAGAPDAVSAILKDYNVKSGLATPFSITTAPASKTNPSLTVKAHSKVTVTKKGKKKVRHNWDIVTVFTNAPAGAKITVNGRTQTKGTGPNTFKFADKAPKKFTTYKVKVAETDTTNAKSASKKVK